MGTPKFDNEVLAEIVKVQHKEIEKLKQGIQKFVNKNFTGGSKSDREDYTQMVSCKDIWDLRELIK